MKALNIITLVVAVSPIFGCATVQEQPFRVNSIPSGAPVAVDGASVGVTPVNLDLACSKHWVGLAVTPGGWAYDKVIHEVTVNPPEGVRGYPQSRKINACEQNYTDQLNFYFESSVGNVESKNDMSSVSDNKSARNSTTESVGPYEKYYRQLPNIDLSKYELLASGKEPCVEIVSANESNRTLLKFHAAGLVGFAESEFVGKISSVNVEDSIWQAKKISAICVVAVKPVQLSSKERIVQERKNDLVNKGTWLEPKYETQTQYVPRQFTDSEYGYSAYYFALNRNDLSFRPYGWYFASLSPEERTKYERNTGAIILYVEEKGPAFYSNVIEGDVIVRAAGVEIRESGELHDVLERIPKNSPMLPITVVRNGKTVDIEMKIGALGK